MKNFHTKSNVLKSSLSLNKIKCRGGKRTRKKLSAIFVSAHTLNFLDSRNISYGPVLFDSFTYF